jgi:hypothetical protein
MSKQIYIIGGGAAGFFCAINIAQKNPNYSVTILEKSTKLLSKVRISGGGRCNVTHACFEAKELVKNYPRGSKELHGAFTRFSPVDMINWLKSKQVALKTESDGRMFPVSDNSETIVNCFLAEAEKLGIKIELNCSVLAIEQQENFLQLHVQFQHEKKQCFNADAVVVCTGGFNQLKAYDFLSNSGHKINAPIPSLFTFNIPNNPIHQLMGLSVPHVKVKIKCSNYFTEGPLLITHWGFSGPAILKLSAFAANELFNQQYETIVTINWLNDEQNEVRTRLQKTFSFHTKTQIGNLTEFALPKRLWHFLIAKAEIPAHKPCSELTKKELNKLVECLVADQYEMKGKTTFKDEFVTCGGIDLREVDFKTMQSKKWNNLYFAGEILNIDGVTGGFNFQAAWTTAWIAALSV